MAEVIDDLERDLQRLTLRHAQLRENLEIHLRHVQEVENRFLSLRPSSDDATKKELRKRMVLAKPWREELNMAYRAILATASELGNVTTRIHQIQNEIAFRTSGR